MLYSTTKIDRKSGIEQINFYLTQGDTANFVSTPTLSDGTSVDLSLVSKCIFKLSDENYQEIFSKEFQKQDTCLVVRLESAETAEIEVGEYIYEVEYTFIDGTVNTPNQSSFEILDQIVKR